MIIGAIALTVLIFLLRFGWPLIKEYFLRGMKDLDEGTRDAGLPG